METRLLLWEGSVLMALHRPWFQLEDRPLPLSLHLFGYGPEFFQYLFPLVHPRELSHLNIGPGFYEVQEAHNHALTRWVELGFVGVASYLVLMTAVVTVGIRVVLDKGATGPGQPKTGYGSYLSVSGRADGGTTGGHSPRFGRSPLLDFARPGGGTPDARTWKIERKYEYPAGSKLFCCSTIHDA